MMLSVHMMGGAALATVMPDSGIGRAGAFIVGTASHYALDSLPHWERLFGTKYNDQLPRDHSLWPKSIYVQGAFDVAASLLLLGYFVSVAPSTHTTCILLGGIGAALPDIIDSAPWWKRRTRNIPILKTLRGIHDAVHMNAHKQRQLPYFTGLLTQLITVGIALLVLLKF